MPFAFGWSGSMWVFPLFGMIIGCTVMLVMVFLVFGRGIRPPWQNDARYPEQRPADESALDILKKRYAKGEISREEFEQMKQDIAG